MSFDDYLIEHHKKEYEQLNDPQYANTDWLENHLKPLIYKWCKPAFDAGIEHERKRHAWAIANTPSSEKQLEMEYLLK